MGCTLMHTRMEGETELSLPYPFTVCGPNTAARRGVAHAQAFQVLYCGHFSIGTFPTCGVEEPEGLHPPK